MQKQIRQRESKCTRRSSVSLCLLLAICTGCSALFSGGASAPLTAFSAESNAMTGIAGLQMDTDWQHRGRILTISSLFTADGRLVNSLDQSCDLGSGVENLAWLPDGRLSCIIGAAPPLLGIFTLDQSGRVKDQTTIPVPIEPYMAVLSIQWNPRELWLATIALATIAGGQVGSIHIPTLYISDRTGRPLFGPMRVDASTLAWSHDGKALALVLNNHPATGNGDIELIHLQPAPAGLLTVTNTQQLAAGTAYVENVEWSPSDRWLVCHYGSYESEDYLFLLAADGSGKRVKLTSSTTDGQLGYPSWSPDGKQLIVTRASDGALLSLDIAALLKEKGVEP